MSILHEKFSFTATDGEVIYGDVRLPAEGFSLPVLIIAHGFKGFKDWGFFPHVADQFASKGWYVVQFNFTHNGVEGHSEEFTQLEKFAENTFSREVRELREVIDTAYSRSLPNGERSDPSKLATLGHSRGGGIVLLEGVNDQRVEAIATWAAVSTFNRYTESQRSRWIEEGYLEVPNTRTGQIMRLNVSLLRDYENHADDFDILKAAASLHRPLLVLHGEVDLSVTIENGEKLSAAADANLTKFVRIPKTGHTFGAAHPFEEPTDALQRAVDETETFLKEVFNEKRT
ncbi:MAG: alpha/beta hydrolase family protein [Candidatus Kapaibacterium sp.]